MRLPAGRPVVERPARRPESPSSSSLVSPAGAAGPSCRTAFAGCRTHAQKIRFCRAACVTTRSVCESAFISGRLERRCASRAVRVCVGEGGSCIHACDAQHPCGADQQCVSGQCIMAPPCKTACGSGCCGGDYPYCGPDFQCWTKPCESVCGDGCCGGDTPVCDGGTCRSGPSGGDGHLHLRQRLVAVPGRRNDPVPGTRAVQGRDHVRARPVARRDGGDAGLLARGSDVLGVRWIGVLGDASDSALDSVGRWP